MGAFQSKQLKSVSIPSTIKSLDYLSFENNKLVNMIINIVLYLK